eukprot:CAMPEP_0181314634 /NCGR_PEP_ID=MMETSP1101-20121128/14927_1 /TAXON_ID=46948 /ORGANISM="Rhodomonas abbreviata, Strain Caron Lab Isolate" /LENGTH=102 /DNA_ID=CAMNT_0023421749 /DNA_START=6 /DNA_END=314 /DNA_ORIENTATION=+
MAEPDVKDEKNVQKGLTKTIEVSVKTPGEEPIKFRVKATSKFEKVANAFGKQLGVDPSKFKFLDAEGQRIAKQTGWSKTMEELGIENEDTIDAMLEQTGGRE